jgi:transcriptional regulator with XRE-family HTH domain
MARAKFSELREHVEARPGAAERLAAKRSETLEEIRLYELRHAEAVSQAELAGRLDVTQGAISKLENAEDVRVSTLRQYLEALGARLELVAVFDDDAGRRVPVHLGKSERSQPRQGKYAGETTHDGAHAGQAASREVGCGEVWDLQRRSEVLVLRKVATTGGQAHRRAACLYLRRVRGFVQ